MTLDSSPLDVETRNLTDDHFELASQCCFHVTTFRCDHRVGRKAAESSAVQAVSWSCSLDELDNAKLKAQLPMDIPSEDAWVLSHIVSAESCSAFGEVHFGSTSNSTMVRTMYLLMTLMCSLDSCSSTAVTCFYCSSRNSYSIPLTMDGSSSSSQTALLCGWLVVVVLSIQLKQRSEREK